ncbi:hypothetical protein ACFVY4_26485, partial [Streptomyces sp. NPDC058299]|uniref:hypothetical protein n=1 Tax=Streptomyces sp. NPDC058299 TaxID=3346435 RepID=UPI0036E582C2
RSVSRLARPATRLATGSRILLHRLAARLTAWAARGRRHDLTGWRAALGCWARIVALIFGLYLLGRLLRAVPALLWLLSTAWTLAAWRAGKPASQARADTGESSAQAPPSGAPELEPRALLIHWLDRLTRDRAGIHLDELHRTLTRHPDLAHLKRAEMRAYLDRHHITVDRTLRVGAVAGRSGVSRATIEALLKTVSPLPETSTSTPSLHGSDLHVSTAESGVESGVEAAVDPHLADVVRLFA